MQNYEEHHHAEEAVKLIFKGVFPLVLFIAGVVILVARISGWSLLLGPPLTVIGLTLILAVFDEITQETVLPRSELTLCQVCQKPTPVIPGIPKEETICLKCRKEMEKA